MLFCKRQLLLQAVSGDSVVAYTAANLAGSVCGASRVTRIGFVCLAAPGWTACTPLSAHCCTRLCPVQAKPAFFCKLLEVMTKDDIALCLSPQGFSNVDPATDIFNNSNQQFWE